MNTISKSIITLKNLVSILFILILSLLITSCTLPEEETMDTGNTRQNIIVSPLINNIGERPIDETKLTKPYKILVVNTGNIPQIFSTDKDSAFTFENHYFLNPSEKNSTNTAGDNIAVGQTGYGKEFFTVLDNSTCVAGQSIGNYGCDLYIQINANASSVDVGKDILVRLKITTYDQEGRFGYATPVYFYGKLVGSKNNTAEIQVVDNFTLLLTAGAENNITVKNIGTHDLVLKAWGIKNNSGDDRGKFSLLTGTLSPACDNTTALSPDTSCSIKVGFDHKPDNEVKRYNAEMFIKSNSFISDNKTIKLMAEVLQDITTMPADKETSNLGSVANKPGEKATADIIVTNNSVVEKTVTLEFAETSTDNTVDKNEYTLEAMTSQIIKVFYTVPDPAPAEIVAKEESTPKLPKLLVKENNEIKSTISPKVKLLANTETTPKLDYDDFTGKPFYQFENANKHVQTIKISTPANGADVEVTSITTVNNKQFKVDNTTCSTITKDKPCSISVAFSKSEISDNQTDYLSIESTAGTKLIKLESDVTATRYISNNVGDLDIPMSFQQGVLAGDNQTQEVYLHNASDSPLTLDLLKDTYYSKITSEKDCAQSIDKICKITKITFELLSGSFIDFTKKEIPLSKTPKINILLTAKIPKPTFAENKVYVNGNSVFAIDKAGSLYVWGDNLHWQLGLKLDEITKNPPDNSTDNPPDNSTKPVLLDTATNYVEVPFPKLSGLFFGNKEYMLAVTDNLTEMYVWGTNTNHQLGTGGPTKSKKTPILLDANTIGIIINANNKIKTIYTGDGYNFLVDDNDYVYAWGNNTDNVIDGTDDSIPSMNTGFLLTPSTKLQASKLFLGNFHTFAISKDNGTVFSWGRNDQGQTGVGTLLPSIESPTALMLDDKILKLNKIYPEDNGSVMATADDETVLYAWGNNEKSQLGLPESSTEITPRKVKIPEGTKIKDIKSGEKFKIALTYDGKVLGWGDNAHSVIGNKKEIPDTTSDIATPTEITMPNNAKISSIYVSKDHVFALGDNGTLFGWGNNDSSQLGTAKDTSTPVEIIDNVTQVYAMPTFTFVIRKDGTLCAWGDNKNKNLGISQTQKVKTPQQVNMPQGVPVSAVYPQETFTIILGTDGLLYSVGNNENGRLGLGVDTNSDTVKSIFDASVNEPITAIKFR